MKSKRWSLRNKRMIKCQKLKRKEKVLSILGLEIRKTRLILTVKKNRIIKLLKTERLRLRNLGRLRRRLRIG
jgi:hypothetical protein